MQTRAASQDRLRMARGFPAGTFLLVALMSLAGAAVAADSGAAAASSGNSFIDAWFATSDACLLYTSPSPRDRG